MGFLPKTCKKPFPLGKGTIILEPKIRFTLILGSMQNLEASSFPDQFSNFIHGKIPAMRFPKRLYPVYRFLCR